MKKLLNRSHWASIISLLLVFSPLRATAQNNMLFKFKSDVFELSGGEQAGVIFTLYASEKTTVTLQTGTVNYTATVDTFQRGVSFEGIIAEDGYMTVYGDPAKLYGLDLSGNYVTWIDLSHWTQIEQLDLQHNAFEALNLSSLSALTYLDLADNPIDPEKFVLGTNHPELRYLSISMIENYPYTGPGLTNFPKLEVFEAYNTHGFTSLDFSDCTEIKKISIDNTSVTNCVLGPVNSELRILNIENCAYTYPGNNFKDFPKLQQLFVGHTTTPSHRLRNIDVSQNPELAYLFVQGNNLTSLDVSANTGLQSLYADNNHLSELDLSANTQLYELALHRNNFTFATLPEPLQQYVSYQYGYQYPIQVVTEIKVGDTLDLSDKVLREGTTTSCYVVMVDNKDTAALPDYVYLYEGRDYSYTDGKLVFHYDQEKPVEVHFYNDLFSGEGSETEIATTPFYVRTAEDYGKPVCRFMVMPADKLSNFMVGVSKSDGTFFSDPSEVPSLYVDWGDGQLREVKPGNSTVITLSKDSIGSQNVSVYLNLGYEITSIASDNNALITIDLSDLQSLSDLTLRHAGLLMLDLSYNRSLTYLNLEGNLLSRLDLNGASGAFTKTRLTSVDASYNHISELVCSEMASVTVLNLSHNLLSEINLKGATALATLNLGKNLLEEIDLSANTELTTVLLDSNRLSAFEMPGEAWSQLDISHNRFTLASLPKYTHRGGYIYAPQADIQIPAKGPGVNLNSQYFTQVFSQYDYNTGITTVDTFTTRFAWFKEDGTRLDSGTHYIVKEGYTAFSEPSSLGKVYGEISHGAYPAFTGANALKTTLIEAAEAPTKLLASFTTSYAVEVEMRLGSYKEGGSIYIDWGDGYPVGYELYTQTPIAPQTATTLYNGQAKIYAYEGEDASPLTVFSVRGIPMKDLVIEDFSTVTTLTLAGCTLKEIDLTNAPNLEDLNLDGNALTSVDLSKTPLLGSLGLMGNKLTSVDLTGLSRLNVLAVDRNKLSSIDLTPVPNVWSLSLSDNELTEIDLSPLPALHQVSLFENYLSEIDFSHNTILRVIDISGNLFTFATLPLPKEDWTIYYYGNQAPLFPEIINGNCIDLRDQASVDGTPTLFYWFDGFYTLDEDGYVTPAPLKDSLDYELSDGYTKFLRSFDTVLALMVNEKLPQLGLNAFALGVKVEGAAVEKTEVLSALKVYVSDGGLNITTEPNRRVEVFNASGQRVALLRADASGRARTGALTAGLYIVRSDDAVQKVLVAR